MHVFMALTVADGKRSLVLTDFATPGAEDLYTFIRDFGARAGIGRYRRFDLRSDSPTLGFHLFEHGIVKLATVAA